MNFSRSLFPATVATCAVCLILGSLISIAAADDKAKTKQVEVKGITLSVPTSWKQEQPRSRLRLAQFRIPAADGDKEDAEVSIFSFGRSSVGDNVKRWIGQFGADGRKSKVTSGKAELGEYVMVEVSGTYNKPVGPPIAGKTEPTPNSRMFAVILEAKDKGVYYLKLTGPDKTVARQAETIRSSFGGEAAKEKNYELDD